MENVANEVKLARGTLYLYFKNKDDIYIAIAIKGSKLLNKMFTECCEGTKPGIEKVKSLILAFVNFQKNTRDIMQLTIIPECFVLRIFLNWMS